MSRERRECAGLALHGLAAAVLIGLVLTAAIPPRTHFLALLNNAGHAPVFGALAWIALRLAPRHRCAGEPRRPRHYFGAFVAVVVAGIAVEVLQSVIGRDASSGDVIMDAAGASFVLCLIAARDLRRSCPHERAATRRALLAGAVIAIVIVAAPLARGALAYAERRAAFPELVRPGRPLGLYFVESGGARLSRAPLPARWADAPGEQALRIEIARASTAGLRLAEPEPDWRGYAQLVLEIVNPGAAPLRLTVRVHDAWHDQRHEDRFNRAYTVGAGSRRTIRIALEEIARAPDGRLLDLGHVAGVGLFESSGHAPVGAAFYLARIALQ